MRSLLRRLLRVPVPLWLRLRRRFAALACLFALFASLRLRLSTALAPLTSAFRPRCFALRLPLLPLLRLLLLPRVTFA